MKIIDRRQFLQMGLATTAGAVAATMLPGVVAGSSRGRSGGSPVAGAGAGRPLFLTPDLSQRRLVVLDCGGGNDGLSMLPPMGCAYSTYVGHRPRTAVPEASLLPIAGSSTVGMNPNLARIHGRSPAILQGVGVMQPDLSHFEMMRRWWSGDQTSNPQTGTGFLGRLCDEIGDVNAPAVGLSLGYGPSPSLISQSAITLSMNPYSDGSFPTFDDIDMHRAWVAAWKVMAERPGNESVPFCSARDGAAYARNFSVMAKRFPAAGGNYPNNDLGYQFQLAARILAQDNGVRILHVPFYADFDTHDQHTVRHNAVLGELDQAVDAFMDDLAARGVADQVLVAMTSEFGRRVPDNESDGLDHGAGNFLFLLGPITGGLFGQYPDLAMDSLDRDQNLVATVSMADYYASLAEDWFGVPASSVIPGGTKITGLIA